MALSGYLLLRQAYNIMGYRSERDKPFSPLWLQVLIIAGSALAQEQGGVKIKGDVTITVIGTNVTTEFSGSGAVADTKIGAIGGGDVDIKGDVKITATGKNVTTKASGSGSAACTSIGTVGSNACE